MKNLYIILIIPFVCQFGFSQDLIVTTSNDSINCKITKVKRDQIFFVFKKNSEVQSTLIPLKNVASYRYDFYEEPNISKDEIPGSNKNSGFRIGVNAGYSYDPGKDYDSGSSELNNYFDKLRSGYHIEGSTIYLFDEYFGLGVRYSYYNANNELIGAFEDPSIVYRDDITVNFIGPQFSLRFLNQSKKNAFFLNSSIGYLSYKNEQDYSNPVKITGNAIGFVSEVGYDIGIAENWSLGLQIGITAGRVKKVTFDDGTSTEEIELPKNQRPQGSGRIDFGMGLRYYP
ncbi:hypothetical protein Murru_2131 [Allomuricauda ruestringensis DSM 13258]|uniref:Outer membrane protein beta-barrel domain-containing protein n=1 Tax=Allomuricauda ruestringensis (strain DSM 13258 / CIP 107369 / LMG 19739 / B1) TaxID=886377 RepID=G2PM73_ALLRU|nr:hypothetical protein [Allomuricauda ruestringensis]AEM71170.1 hypothetical protein Murru_2131 [Allomuricauda ruestringensis DSM 13258]